MIRITLSTLTVFLLGITCANAESFTPVERGTYSLDLDTTDGNFSQWALNDLSGVNATRAKVTFARKGKHKTYAALATLSVEGKTRQVYIRFAALSDNGPLYSTVTLADSNGQIKEEVVLLPPDMKETFDLHVQWTPEGKVIFDLFDHANKDVGQGFERHEIEMGEPVTALKIINSTGEVAIDPLQVGQATP